MSVPKLGSKLRRVLLAGSAAVALTAGVLAGVDPAHAATSLPCDIYASGGTPCVAAHSTTRALFGSYNGPLYQIQRASICTGLRGAGVRVERRLDGSVAARFRERMGRLAADVARERFTLQANADKIVAAFRSAWRGR